ncbi:MAG TPA: heme-binding domain-containing protein [Ignavibacteriaceae bacterium]|nr:heme-binding domain-containing protein [Ignavibacteriaceae bacterium]
MAASKKSGKRKFFKYSAIIIVILFIIIQFIPVRRTNPPIVKEPPWDSPETRAFAVRACFDCHSNETKWPAYSYVAPVSWFVLSDVNEGRKHFNMSDWKPRDGDESAQEVRKGDMPMWKYTLMHSEAKLSDIEKKKFIAGLVATFGEEKENNNNKSNNVKRNKTIRFSDEGED